MIINLLYGSTFLLAATVPNSSAADKDEKAKLLRGSL